MAASDAFTSAGFTYNATPPTLMKRGDVWPVYGDADVTGNRTVDYVLVCRTSPDYYNPTGDSLLPAFKTAAGRTNVRPVSGTSASQYFVGVRSVGLAGGSAAPGTSLTPDSFTYDAQGRVVVAQSGGVSTTYTYNADDSVATETVGGVTKTYQYDPQSRITGTVVS